MRIDLHTHAFSEAIADKAMTALKSKLPEGFTTPFDGHLASLISELKRYDFQKAALCQIATRPSQFEPILKWSRAIKAGELGDDAQQMIEPIPSIHPADPERNKHLAEVASNGFKGIKLHPFYQEFVIDSPELIDTFKAIRDNGLFAVVHCGYDIGYPRIDIAAPKRIVNLLSKVPNLRLMVTHFGGWQDWEAVSELLIGQPIDIEISMAIGFCPLELLTSMLERHPIDHLYFGSDWPWSEYSKTLPILDAIPLSEERRNALMGDNAARWLSIK